MCTAALCVCIHKVCVRPVDTLRFNLITAGVMKRKRGGSGNRRSEQDGKDRLRRRGKGWREGGRWSAEWEWCHENAHAPSHKHTNDTKEMVEGKTHERS